MIFNINRRMEYLLGRLSDEIEDIEFIVTPIHWQDSSINKSARAQDYDRQYDFILALEQELGDYIYIIGNRLKSQTIPLDEMSDCPITAYTYSLVIAFLIASDDFHLNRSNRNPFTLVFSRSYMAKSLLIDYNLLHKKGRDVTAFYFSKGL